MSSTTFSSSAYSTLSRPASAMTNASLALAGAAAGPGSASARSVPAKSFGSSNYVLKEEYERERQRWHQKLEEAEARLVEAALQNTELNQVKAQLVSHHMLICLLY